MAEARTLVKLLAALLALCIPTLASATEYHVTPLTFGKPSLMALRPGDILWLGSGTYAGGLEAYSLPAGTADAPITVRAEVSGLAIIEGGVRDCWSLAGCNYWTFDGLVFQKAGRVGLYLGPSSHATVRNCVMRQNQNSGMLTGHAEDLVVDGCEMYGNLDQHGLYVSSASNRFTVRNSSFYRNRRAGVQANNQGETNPFIGGTIANCRFFSNGGATEQGGDPIAAAINILLVKNVRVTNCQLTNNFAQGITLSGTTGCTVDACQITFAPGTGYRCVNSSNGSDATNRVQNCLFLMGQPKPPTDGILTQSNNTLTVMPTPVVATPDPTPVPSPVP